MKLIRLFMIANLALFFSAVSAQVTKVPQAAKDNFAKQYPAAENVEWNNEVLSVTVGFTLNGENMDAEYNNKGIWKSTLQDLPFEKFPAAVKDGFSKSKYADREITDAKKVYFPGDVIQYRIKAERNDLEKKYLFFNENGQLVRETITL